VATGNPHPNLAPYETYETRTGTIFIAAGNDGQFRRLCEILGAPELARDPRFATNADRLAHRPALIAALSALLADRDGAALALELLRAGLPAGPVRPVDVALADPHTEARQMVVTLAEWRGLGTPIKFGRTPGGPKAPPPVLPSTPMRCSPRTVSVRRRSGRSRRKGCWCAPAAGSESPFSGRGAP